MIRLYLLALLIVFAGCLKTDYEDLKQGTVIAGFPVIINTAYSNVSNSSAILSAEVESSPRYMYKITKRGFVVSRYVNPTIESSLFNIVSKVSDFGSYSCNVDGLSINTGYYFRAYAISEDRISYGETVYFYTQKIDSEYSTFVANGVGFRMIKVEGGTFSMGDSFGDGASSQKPLHDVTLSTYWIGDTEVTQALWEAVMGGNPSHFKGAIRPVEKVSWDDCQLFITKLNEATGKTFRLPTEAEWEYAARGGNKSKGYRYSGSNDVGAVAWYDMNSNNTTHDVRTKLSNELGIFDMSGNVWEWCSDWYGSYTNDAQINPTGPTSGPGRVQRGGGWSNGQSSCGVSYRSYFTPDYRNANFGLRIAMSE